VFVYPHFTSPFPSLGASQYELAGKIEFEVLAFPTIVSTLLLHDLPLKSGTNVDRCRKVSTTVERRCPA
jgi:hypothetical protein